ncbi:YihY/virulence factor BrkB family protein [bacterium]|nr:YihY/virulence factor BrkB family protein [bacterium]
MKRFIVYLKRLITSVLDNDFFGMASEMSYMLCLGIFPMMLFLTGIFGWLGKHEFMRPIFAFMSSIMPGESMSLVQTVLKEVIFYTKGGFWAILGFIITCFLTTNMVAIIAKGLNRAYKINETRSFLYTRAVAFLMVCVDTAVLFLTINLIIFGKIIINFCVVYLNLGQNFADIWMFFRWPIAFCALYLMAFLHYYLLPDMKGSEKLKLKSTVPGTFFFCISWLIGSGIFAMYVNNLHTYNFVYGTIGAFAVLMVWLYYTSILMLIGATINSTVYNRLEIKGNGK